AQQALRPLGHRIAIGRVKITKAVAEMVGRRRLGRRLCTRRQDAGDEKTGGGDQDCQRDGYPDETAPIQLVHDTTSAAQTASGQTTGGAPPAAGCDLAAALGILGLPVAQASSTQTASGVTVCAAIVSTQNRCTASRSCRR